MKLENDDSLERPEIGSAASERIMVELPPGAVIYRPDHDPPVPPQNLPETDGVPLESEWHRLAIALLIESIRWHWRERKNFYVGGNSFVYFSAQQVRNKDYRGPDFFLVHGVSSQHARAYWAIWDEQGKYPDLIIELLSPSTKQEDLTVKKDLYEKTFHTYEYCCYDPDVDTLIGWTEHNKYEPIVPNDKGWLWLDKTGLWLGIWQGTYQGLYACWPRFFDANGSLFLTKGEHESLRADAEKMRADAEKQNTQIARQRAEAEKQRAEAEKQRADAFEAELARLKAQFPLQPNPPS